MVDNLTSIIMTISRNMYRVNELRVRTLVKNIIREVQEKSSRQMKSFVFYFINNEVLIRTYV